MTHEKTHVFYLTGQCSSPRANCEFAGQKKDGKTVISCCTFRVRVVSAFFLKPIHTTSGYRTLSRIMQSNTSKKPRAQVAKQKSDLFQIMATSHESEEGNWDPLFQRNLGWWNIILWPAHLCQSVKERLPGNCAGDFLGQWVHVTLFKDLWLVDKKVTLKHLVDPPILFLILCRNFNT